MAINFQISFRRQTYQFNFKIGFTILCLFFFVLFCMLGVWQLHRYAYKKNLIAQQSKSLSVSGNYQNDLTLIIQNKFYNGQDGFEIITPLKITHEKKLLLIDRGWIKKIGDALPNLAVIKGQQQIIGHIKQLDEYQFILGKNLLTQQSHYIVMQKIDINELHELTGQDFYSFILRLDASQPNGFTRDWVISAMMPERHMGYAIQWFAMAAVLFIAYLCFCCEKVKDEKFT